LNPKGDVIYQVIQLVLGLWSFSVPTMFYFKRRSTIDPHAINSEHISVVSQFKSFLTSENIVVLDKYDVDCKSDNQTTDKPLQQNSTWSVFVLLV